jgi:hypothetical protein
MNRQPDFKPFKTPAHDWAASCPNPERCGKVIQFGEARYLILVRPLGGERYEVATESYFPGPVGRGLNMGKEYDSLKAAHSAFNFAVDMILVAITKSSIAFDGEDETAYVSDVVEHREGEPLSAATFGPTEGGGAEATS